MKNLHPSPFDGWRLFFLYLFLATFFKKSVGCRGETPALELAHYGVEAIELFVEYLFGVEGFVE